jgi:hypothetical protein
MVVLLARLSIRNYYMMLRVLRWLYLSKLETILIFTHLRIMLTMLVSCLEDQIMLYSLIGFICQLATMEELHLLSFQELMSSDQRVKYQQIRSLLNGLNARDLTLNLKWELSLVKAINKGILLKLLMFMIIYLDILF